MTPNRYLDFGAGFYTTTNYDQALNFAGKVTMRKKCGRSTVNIYELGESIFENVNVLNFESADEAWLEYQKTKTRDDSYSDKGKGTKDEVKVAEESKAEDPVVANAHGDSWVHIPGKGRMTWTEVEMYVNMNPPKIKEYISSDGKVSYTWVR